MGILLAFVPFIAFALADRLLGSLDGLIAGAVVSAILIGHDWMAARRSPKLLELGTAALFTSLAGYYVLAGPNWSIMKVRLLVDSGLLLIVLLSIALRRPFTLQYAREQVAPEFWDKPGFIRTNKVISGAWALAFAVLVAADWTMAEGAGVPTGLPVTATIMALVAAVKFTAWYPKHRVKLLAKA